MRHIHSIYCRFRQGLRTIGAPNPENEFATRFINSGKGIEITNYTGNKRQVVILSKIQEILVTVIGDEAFKEKKLTGVTIPDSVTVIGNKAFSKNQLTSVSIPDNPLLT